MGAWEIVLQACGASACGLIGVGLVRLSAAIRRYRAARLDADYRAAALVINTKRVIRAAHHRAAERKWGRAA